MTELERHITDAADAEDDIDTDAPDRASIGAGRAIAIGFAVAVGFVTGVAATLVITGGL